jgi:hypothetical protein
MLRFHRLCRTTASALAWCFISSTFTVVLAAPPTSTQAVGGPAGNTFSYQCPSGQFLVGFRAKAGQVVDRIGPVCAAWDPVRRATLASHDIRAEFGGPGGEWTRFGCPPNSAISGWLVEDSRGENPLVVGNIAEEECRSLEPPFNQIVVRRQFIGHTQDATGGITGTFKGEHFKTGPIWARCPVGQLANGIWGRAGQFVNAVGLFCATPVTAAPQPADAPPAAQTEHRGPMGARSPLATAKDDVDIYSDQPDRNPRAAVVAIMRKGESHRVSQQIGGWTALVYATGPTREGWVATDHLTIKRP